tara:strand:- start:8947 stop:9234 length:288 start_codon:yes stop_codon:yes gene_type:complete
LDYFYRDAQGVGGFDLGGSRRALKNPPIVGSALHGHASSDTVVGQSACTLICFYRFDGVRSTDAVVRAARQEAKAYQESLKGLNLFAPRASLDHH